MSGAERYERVIEGSLADLGRDLLWFCIHSVVAVGVLALALSAMTVLHPDADADRAKLLATALALIVPALAGFLVGRAGFRSPRSWPARYCCITGVIVFVAAAVWVAGMPSGPGMCGGCGPAEKIWRTFFSLDRGSGLMGGDGLLVGVWVPLATFGYSAGAALGLR